MDRTKIKNAARLDAELEKLEWLMKCCKDNGARGDYENLMWILSPLGKEEAWATILREAEKDRIEFDHKIAEL